MNAGAHTDGGLSAVSLLNAVFCADCETISNSPHDACTVCGSRSLINLFRMLGGTVRSQKPQSAEDHAKTAKYNLERKHLSKTPVPGRRFVLKFPHERRTEAFST